MFEKRAKSFREAAGLTQQQAGADIGVAGATVDSWERKGKMPGADSFVRMAKLYGRKPEEFFDESAVPAPGFTLQVSPDVPDALRREAVRLVRELNRRYRTARGAASQEAPPVAVVRKLKAVRDD